MPQLVSATMVGERTINMNSELIEFLQLITLFLWLLVYVSLLYHKRHTTRPSIHWTLPFLSIPKKANGTQGMMIV